MRGGFCFGLHHSWNPFFLAFPMDRRVRALKEAQGTAVLGCGTACEDACPDWALGCCSSPRHLCSQWGVFLGTLCGARMHMLYLCETFCTTCHQYSDKDDFILYNSQLVIYSRMYSKGWPWCCVWRVSPPVHCLQRPPHKSRDMNKGQGSLPWATKAVPENKNSTKRAHKRQKILPSCQLLSRPCLQRRGVQGQAIPSAKELQQRAHQHVPGPGLPLQPCHALP